MYICFAHRIQPALNILISSFTLLEFDPAVLIFVIHKQSTLCSILTLNFQNAQFTRQTFVNGDERPQL